MGNTRDSVAVPSEIVALPSDTPFEKNVTDPAGVPAPGLGTVTAAVKVTFSNGVGFEFEIESAMLVGAKTTAKAFGIDVLPE
jgi:hypothetical protein